MITKLGFRGKHISTRRTGNNPLFRVGPHMIRQFILRTKFRFASGPATGNNFSFFAILRIAIHMHLYVLQKIVECGVVLRAVFPFTVVTPYDFWYCVFDSLCTFWQLDSLQNVVTDVHEFCVISVVNYVLGYNFNVGSHV